MEWEGKGREEEEKRGEVEEKGGVEKRRKEREGEG